MVKKNLSVVVVIAVLLTLAVGYALFSQTINITGTATAQGSFLIDASCISSIPDYLTSKVSFSNDDEKGTSNETCEVDQSGTVVFHADMAYPGALKYYVLKFTNNGTVSAKIGENDVYADEFNVCLDGSNTIDSTNTPNGQIEEEKECANMIGQSDPYGFLNLLTLINLHDSDFVFETAGPNHARYNKNDSEFESHTDENGNIILEPGESIYLPVSLEFDSRWSDSVLLTNEVKLRFVFNQK